MADFLFDNVHVSSLVTVVPSYVHKNLANSPDPKRSRYVRSFIKQTGVEQCHLSITEQTCTDYGYIASKIALQRAGITSDDLDAIIFLTQTPDLNAATTNAHLVHYLLHAPVRAIAFDVPGGCTSFPYGLVIASSLLQQKSINRVLLIFGDTERCGFSSKEQLMASDSTLFGEASSALILDKKNGTEIKASLYADGSGYRFLFNPFEGFRNCWRVGKQKKYCLPRIGELQTYGRYMDGMEITSFSTTTAVDAIKEFLKKNSHTVDDYDGIILHQANLQIVKTITKRLGVSQAKVPTTLQAYGNTSAASIPLTISSTYANGPCNKRLKLLTCGFGVGLSWGVASLEIEVNVVAPISNTDELFDECLFFE